MSRFTYCLTVKEYHDEQLIDRTACYRECLLLVFVIVDYLYKSEVLQTVVGQRKKRVTLKSIL